MSNRELHTVQAGAWLPLAQSGITGGTVGAVALVIGLMVRARSPWGIALLVGLVVWGLSWFALQNHWYRLTGAELVNFPEVAEDYQQVATWGEVRVKLDQVKDDGDWQQNVYNLPGSQDQLMELARGLLLDNLSLGERSWVGAGRPFSVNQFRALRTEMLRRGLIILASGKDARQGFTLTREGRAVMRGFIPSPTEQQRGG